MSDIFSRVIKNDTLYFKHAKGISERSGKEFHLFHELILFLGGDAELISETVHTKLKPHTLAVIPKETYHQVLINGNQNAYFRCIFQFYDTEDNAHLVEAAMQELFVIETDENISYLFSKMMHLAKKPNTAECTCLSKSILHLLLDEIQAKKSMESQENLNNDITKQAIEYISEHLTESLHTADIAHHLSISPSTLMHTFKETMNISIHQYIIKKRLILAHTRISKGEPPSTVSLECGFHDYSGFYKQYKKMFDITPTNRTRK